MFGLFKKKMAPHEPVELAAVVPVDAAPERFFELVDFSDPANAKRELGHEVRQTGNGNFVLVMSFMPDLEFPIVVEKCERPVRYAYSTQMPEGVGNLVRSEESYQIEKSEEGGCIVVLTMKAELQPGLTMREYNREIGMLTLSLQNSMAKMKLHAEGGIEDVREFERQQAGQSVRRSVF